MRIAAWSDGHGTLPIIDRTVDVMIIAGDLVPLYYQRQTTTSMDWFTDEFFEYVKDAPCKKVLLVPGNHDFLFERISPDTIKEIIASHPDIKDKLVLLIDEEYEYKGQKFYGCPWCTGPYGWAFCPCDTDPDVSYYYNHIPEDTTILITHQPPKIDRVGCSYPYQPQERNFGSDRLTSIIDTLESLRYVFCGHIHTGTHNGVQFDKKMIYNVSIMNEDYNNTYDVTYLDI